MIIVFLPSSDEDVRWFARYYRSAFPEGGRNARLQMERTLEALSDNPRLGHPLPGTLQREYSIPRTPFSLIYQVTNDRIEILRLWDGRANRDRLSAPDQGSDRQ